MLPTSQPQCCIADAGAQCRTSFLCRTAYVICYNGLSETTQERSARMLRSHSTFPLLLAVVLALAFMTTQPRAHAAGNTYVVNTTNDDALSAQPSACTPTFECSLRQALQIANNSSSSSQIQFLIPTSDSGYNHATGQWSIKPTSPLPEIHPLSGGSIDIDETINHNPYVPQIILDGSSMSTPLPANNVGLTISSSNNTIERLAIINFAGSTALSGIGIRIYTPLGSPAVTNNTLIGNFIGVIPSDTNAHPNAHAGIQIDTGASQNIIGSASQSNGNTVAGNGQVGIQLTDAYTNTIQNNNVGVMPTGFIPYATVPNGSDGIQLLDSYNNTLGGT